MKVGYFLAGVGSTIFAEMLIFFGAACVYAFKHYRKPKSESEDQDK